MSWKIVSASVTGKGHLDQNQPCQDALHHAVVHGVLQAVICDGAGSASHSQTGATFMSQQVVRGLSALLEAKELPSLQPANQDIFTNALRTVIAHARDQLMATLSLPVPEDASASISDQNADQGLPGREGSVPAAQQLQQQQPQMESTQVSLRDFACTLVGCVIADEGGYFFHIGDGFAIHQQSSGLAQLSSPENGEYADETYFVTDDNWQEHLRITPVAPLDADSFIGLMSDGPAPFAVNKTKTAFYLPFIEPVMRFLRTVPEAEGCLALKNLLENEKTHRITADDKSLLLVFKP